jgi:hypothetical protein
MVKEKMANSFAFSFLSAVADPSVLSTAVPWRMLNSVRIQVFGRSLVVRVICEEFIPVDLRLLADGF